MGARMHAIYSASISYLCKGQQANAWGNFIDIAYRQADLEVLHVMWYYMVLVSARLLTPS